MAGTLTISTLSDGTNSTSSTNCIQGSAKAWVNFNGTTSTIKASYNVSSITSIATGKKQVNMTNAMSDTNYSAVASVNQTALNGLLGTKTATTTTSAFQIDMGQSGALSDFTDVSVVVFR